MTIGIDANEANVEKRVGVSEFAHELIRNWHEMRKKGEIEHNFQVYLKNEPLPHMPEETEFFEYKVIGPKRLWSQFALPLRLTLPGQKPDVFFSPTHYAPRFARVPRVISIMDLAYLYYGETFNQSDLYQLKNWTKYSVEKAKKIITISQSTKNDILENYNVKFDKVDVVYPGIKYKETVKKNVLKKLADRRKTMKKYQIDGKYILFVSTLQPRKNIERLVEAFSKVKKTEKDLRLVIVGKKGWKFQQILESPKKYKVEDSVQFLDFVEDEDLAALYKNAKLFVMPSLYEGFGLTILEAMKHGCPVATSDISSLPEAGGEAAAYFDPKSAEDMAMVIRGVVIDKKKQDAMREEGYKQVEKFSWEKSAKEALKVLESVARK